MKRLNEFMDCPYDNEIMDIKSDSRAVVPGDLFVAVKGFMVDHADFIPDAIARGAVAVVTDRNMELEVPVIQVEDVNQALFDICRRFYDLDQSAIKLIGITGTDGKTTTATILQNLLEKFSSSAYIGTNGFVFRNQTLPSENTTPLTETLYHYLQNLNNDHCQYLSLEVSSEALLHRRVDDLKFRYAVLTNISEDHLNIHKTLENYIAAKAKLFSLLSSDGYAILNADDSHFTEVKCKVKAKICTYGVENGVNFLIKNVDYSVNGTSFDIVHDTQVFHIESPYVGLYNVYNLTAAFIVCYLEGYDVEKIIGYIKRLSPVPGRAEILDFGQNYKIILDYAHTANGIKNILDTIRMTKPKRIITVVGSAGGREKEKRALMGRYTLEKSDFVIFTMDDPRTEKVDDIIDDLVSGSDKKNYVRVENREEAIAKAFDMANEGDVVAILGKGRDTYMAVGNQKIYYCDYDVIEKYFQNRT